MKKFKVGDVVTSITGIGKVSKVTKDARYPIEVLYDDPEIGYGSFTEDGVRRIGEPVSLFLGKGKVDVVFTPEPEPVYEYQWLVKCGGNKSVFATERFYKTEEELQAFCISNVQILERLDKYKREVK